MTPRGVLLGFLVVALLSAQLATALVDIPAWASGGRVARELEKRTSVNKKLSASASEARWFTQLIDHDNESAGTFQQRWWTDYDETNPPTSNVAILYIYGEGVANGIPGGYLHEYSTSIGATIFALEHRFYGDSMPAPLTDRETLKQLTLENALADLKALKDYAAANVLKSTFQWIAVGGSYSGAVSVWLRETYPDDFTAAWSSSGVVNTVFDFHAFDGHVASVLPVTCANAIKETFNMFSSAFDNKSERENMLNIFGTPDYFTKGDMSWMLADGSAMAVQYGFKNEFCNSILPFEKDKAFQRYSDAIKDLWGDGFTSDCYYSTECLSNPSYSDQWSSNYAWVYQCCTQFAYWQASYPGSLRTKDITTEYYINQCRSAFGDDTFPDTYAHNAKYGGATPKISRVIALQGSDDPWLPAGTMTSLGDDYPRVLAQCNQCGHCKDLHGSSDSDPASLKDQREAIRTHLNKWLGISS